MSQNFQPGDFLVFQLEAGFALLRLLAVDGTGSEAVWHVAAYNELFLDVESAETASLSGNSLTVSEAHLAVTTRAFESTQVARLANVRLTENELVQLTAWKNDPAREISDRSVRLMLGLR